MTDDGKKKQPGGLEIIGALLVIHGLISTVIRLAGGQDVALLALVDKFVVPTAWWAGLVCALVGLAFIFAQQLRKPAVSR
ncbi:hypothetical protein [Amycolatopsis nigrescens]|uniref:hypothetical protein n=1 Tax=Amycolatopsis nigrescens TaxID=381445 RepID=UPI000362207A|nr:hypothetical protein [Amycolatopsis nigrescens]